MSDDAMSRVILVANRKGGVGKTSLTRNLAYCAAQGGLRVAVIDGDQQGNLTEDEYGVFDGDAGRALATVMMFGTDTALPTVRTCDGVDLVQGGPCLTQAISAMTSLTHDLARNTIAALERLQQDNNYDLLFIDSGPGDTVLLDAFLQASRRLIIPTKSDDASATGVSQLAQRYKIARKQGAQVQVLGSALMFADRQATKRNRYIAENLSGLLGDHAQPFETAIRHAEAVAIDARRHGLSADGVAQVAQHMKKKQLAALSAAKKQGAGSGTLEHDGAPWHTRPTTSVGVADDYKTLTQEMLARLSHAERQAA